MLLNLKTFTKHAVDRVVEAYGASPKIGPLLNLISTNAKKGLVEWGSDQELYVIIPKEGVFVVKGDSIVTFIHKKRIGTHGECQRAYARFS